MTRVAKRPGSGKPPSNAPARGAGVGGAAGGDKGRGERAAADALVPGAAVGLERDEHGRFLLSPKGVAAELIAQEALARDVMMMRDPEEWAGRAFDAAGRVQDRIWGRPKQAVEGSGPDGSPLQIVYKWARDD